MLVLHLSDTHLGATPHGLPFRHKDVLESFVEAMEIALREHVDAVIHAGDFFDRAHPPPDAYIVAYRCLAKLAERGIKIFVVAGQHDLPRKYTVSPLEFLRTTGVTNYVAIDDIAKWRISIGGREYEIVAVPYSKRSSLSLAKPEHRNSILVAHLLLREVGVPQFDASLNDIPKMYRYVALGDYHNKKVFYLDSGTPVVYPGATEVFKRDEWSDEGKHVVLVDLSGDEPTLHFVKLSRVRPWIFGRYDSVAQAIEEIARRARELVKQGFKPPMVSISFTAPQPSLTPFYREMDKLVRDGVIAHYFEPEVPSKPKESSELMKEVEFETIDLDRVVEEIVGDARLAKLLIDLIKDPSDATARAFVEALVSDEELLRIAEQNLVLRNLGTAKTRQDSKELRSGKGLTRFFR